MFYGNETATPAWPLPTAGHARRPDYAFLPFANWRIVSSAARPMLAHMALRWRLVKTSQLCDRARSSKRPCAA